MKRTITVYNSSTQRKSVLEGVEVETLGELKSLLREKGIDYNSMDFMEGVSQTKLVNDSSVLPHDIPYKGSRTNDLLIYLSLTDKKIKSGSDIEKLDRRSLLAYAKEHGYVEALNHDFGTNYTRIPSKDIVAFIKKYEDQNTPPAEEVKAAPKCDNKKESCMCDTLINHFNNLVNTLYNADVLDSADVEVLLIREDSKPDSINKSDDAGFSMDEIHQMMNR